MPINPETLIDNELENLIQNHRNKGATEAPLYAEALRERERRKGRGLDFDKSFTIIKKAASEGRFLSYKELADTSGADWGKAHYAIGGHLWNLVEYAHHKNWPMLSSIVVNKPNIETGKMEPDTLKGFVGAARALGYSFADDEKFLREQQKLVFEWAKNTAKNSSLKANDKM